MILCFGLAMSPISNIFLPVGLASPHTVEGQTHYVVFFKCGDKKKPALTWERFSVVLVRKKESVSSHLLSGYKILLQLAYFDFFFLIIISLPFSPTHPFSFGLSSHLPHEKDLSARLTTQ